MNAKQCTALLAAFAAMTATLAGCGKQLAPASSTLQSETASSTTSYYGSSLPAEDFPTRTQTEPTTLWDYTSQRSTSTSKSASKSTTAKVTSTKADGAGQGKYAFDYEGIHPAVAVFSEDKWYLMLVSREYALPADYSPKTAVCLPGVYSQEREMDARVAPEYRKMYNAAKKEGAELVPYSGYRRIVKQKENFDNKIASYRSQGYSNAEAVNLAAKVILPPGCSEHEAGLAMDIATPQLWDTSVSFEKSKEFAWLMEHGAEYGFILRYPKDKQSITNITYEPWHWRYVGVEAATEIMENGLCLEEYLGNN
ncbi:MAG: M15 family metallopeptidase [Oscillospiraceae bacterium]|jgi:D-alanyl-D-alanine carboxypeptidase|nr:M15 family metallopeptidase [Oscillospiraceae bacterium]